MKAILLFAAIISGLGSFDWPNWKKHPGNIKGKASYSDLLNKSKCMQEMAIDLSLCMSAKANPWANITYATLPLILK